MLGNDEMRFCFVFLLRNGYSTPTCTEAACINFVNKISFLNSIAILNIDKYN